MAGCHNSASSPARTRADSRSAHFRGSAWSPFSSTQRVSVSRTVASRAGVVCRRLRTDTARVTRANGHKLVDIYRDAGVSGSNGLGSRVGLADALEPLRDGAAAGLVVYKLDRLARGLIVQDQILAEVRRLGGETFSTFAR